MTYRNLDEVLKAIDNGLLVTINVPDALMDFVDKENIDHVISSLPEEQREFVLDWAHGFLFAPKEELITLMGVSNFAPLGPEDLVHPRDGIVQDAFGDWFRRHSWAKSHNTKNESLES